MDKEKEELFNIVKALADNYERIKGEKRHDRILRLATAIHTHLTRKDV